MTTSSHTPNKWRPLCQGCRPENVVPHRCKGQLLFPYEYLRCTCECVEAH